MGATSRLNVGGAGAAFAAVTSASATATAVRRSVTVIRLITQFHKYGDVFWPQRHRDTEKNTRLTTLDAAPRSGGSGGKPVNERPPGGERVVCSPVARPPPRPAVQADRVERRLCASVSLWLD